MSRRNPLNKRYQKEGQPKGASKKSAARVKPARSKGRKAPSTTSKKHPDRGAKSKALAQARSPIPDTDEYRDARKKWWIVLGVAVLVMTFSLILTFESALEAVPLPDSFLILLRSVLSWVALGLVGFSWWLDFKILRPMMKAYKEEQQCSD